MELKKCCEEVGKGVSLRMMFRRILFFIMLILSFPVFGFPGSLPQPHKNGRDSLVLLVEQNKDGIAVPGSSDLLFKGPVERKIHPGKKGWSVVYFRLPEGSYTISGNVTVSISANSIVLLPVRVNVVRMQDGSIRLEIDPVDEGDRQKAAKDLAYHIDFTSWAGREFKGFGTIKPSLQAGQTRHELVLSSEPSNAEIFLDNVAVGKTPMTFLIDENKHQLRLKLDSYTDDVRYVSLQRSAEIEAVLKPVKTAVKSKRVRYRTLTAPFYAVSGKEDEMASLLGDSLVPVLQDDARLEIVRGKITWKKYSGLLQPDFNNPELKDIDLIATGIYTRKGDMLTVIASLYDVRTETVRAGITWNGPAGLNIFDAVDEISLAFRNEVDKVLPEAGKILIRKNLIIYSGLSPLDARIERKRFVQMRQEHRHTLSVLSGIGGSFIQLKVSGPVSSHPRTVNPSDGPFVPLVLDYEQYMGEYFSLGFGGEIGSSKIALFHGDSGTVYSPLLLSFNVSARAVVRGLKSDLILGLGPSFQIITKAAAVWQDNGSTFKDVIGPVFITGLQWNAGFRLYLNKRIDTMPSFLYFGFSLGMPQYYFEPGGVNEGFSSSRLGIYLGGGLML